jgi:hypothetical protein
MTLKRLKKKFVLSSLFLFLIMFLNWGGLSVAEAAEPPKHGIAAETVADYLYALIAADRTIYTKLVVERLQNQGVVLAAEDWEKRHALLLPAQFLMESARLVAEKDQGIRFRLIGLWPTYRRNAPATDFERKGLEAVRANPDQAFTGVSTSGKKDFFQAIYADAAVSEACVVCHNTHPQSPKRDFQVGDVMGGVVITIPLNP